MYKQYCVIFFILIYISCSDRSPVDNNPNSDNQIEIIAPTKITSGDIVPIVVRVKENNELNKQFTETLILTSDCAILEPGEIKVKKGIGSISCKIICNSDFTIEVDYSTCNGNKKISIIDSVNTKKLSGTLSDTTLYWEAGSEIEITDNLNLPANSTLVIEKGTCIKLGSLVNFDIEGHIFCRGTKDEPVVITSTNPVQPWGQFNHNNSSGEYRYTIFTNGGADNSRVHGHSHSEPVIFGDNSNVSLFNCFIFDNPGKAAGSKWCYFTIDSCLISRCDTGAELGHSIININESYFIDIPSDDGIFIDDDNDALYLAGTYTDSVYSTITNCVFITGKDDAIDHNSSNLIISGCWIEGFMHEGLAASGKNKANLYNTVVKNCQQGVEAGYGNPEVIVDHCVFIENEVGVRFGDNYDWGCTGHITVTNTIVYDNIENIKNFDLKFNSSIDGAITISYSLIKDEPWNQETGCVTGTPLFDSNYYLLPSSPGRGAGNDGLDIGLVK